MEARVKYVWSMKYLRNTWDETEKIIRVVARGVTDATDRLRATIWNLHKDRPIVVGAAREGKVYV